jgi:hypothetical protein
MMPQRKPEGRTKLRLLLTPSEHQKLAEVAQQTGTNRSLIILEAIQAGLANQHLRITQEKRCKRTDAWIPTAVKTQLRQLAGALNVTQQHLTRHLLSIYLTSPPWDQKHMEPQTEVGKEAE